MENLQRDLAAIGVHRVGNHSVAAGGTRGCQARAKRRQPAFDVWRKSAGHDKAHTATGALGKICRKLREILYLVFEPGMHGAHENAVF